MSAETELFALRVTVARLAQSLGLDEHIPGAEGRTGLSYEDLRQCAMSQERGWHRLCAHIIDYTEERSKQDG